MATLLAYQPAWNGKPIWDDPAQMTAPSLRSLKGLERIWIEPGATQQYYPVVYSFFWLESKLWDEATLGYHLVNILLHVTAALLLLKILRTLGVDAMAAGLAAAIFALHPVQVESVAWISELKNTLSTVCYFASALAYLRFSEIRNGFAYAIALLLFVMGLLAKTAIATLPAALLVVFWWRRGKLSWKQDVFPLIPFFAASITAGLFTSAMERQLVGAHGVEFNFSIVGRCLIAGRAVWFYLAKIFWPADLIFSYPRWDIDPSQAWQYLFPLGLVLLLGTTWALRRWRRGPLAALLFFIGTLFPALGFVNVFYFKYSFVADHFQYVAASGPIVAASIGIHSFFSRFNGRGLVWERAFFAVLLATLGLLTWRQSRIYTDVETLWRATLERNPDSWLADNDLGSVLFAKGQVDQAISLFQAALKLQADAEANYNLGSAYEKKGLSDEALTYFQKALALRPNFAEAHRSIGSILLRRGRLDDALREFQQAVAIRPDAPELHSILGNALLQKGESDEAITQFQQAVELDPNDDQALYNLGLALLRKGQMDGAILEFQEVVELRPNFAEAQNNLGFALLRSGQTEAAITHLRKALEILPDYGPAHYNLGNALLQKGAVDEAIVEFQKLLALQPDSGPARSALASALRQKDASLHPVKP